MESLITHIVTFIIGLLTGIFGNYFANRLTEKAKRKDGFKAKKTLYKEMEVKMPLLIKEMKNDIQDPSMLNCREFFISPSKRVVLNTKNNAFIYYEDEHENLLSKIRILENNGLILDITPGNTPKYQFQEEFFTYLKNEK